MSAGPSKRGGGGIRPSRAGSHKALELSRARSAAARSGASPWAADPRSRQDAADRFRADRERAARGRAHMPSAPRVSWKTSPRPFPVLIVGADTAGIAFKLRPPAVEVRIDLFPRDDQRIAALMDDLRGFASVLLTARRDVDGGAWPRGDETARRRFLLKLVGRADCVDVELDLAEDEAARHFLSQVRRALRPNASLLVSQHDCHGLPSKDRLDAFLQVARYVRPDRFKLAAIVKTEAEAKRLCGWTIANATAELPITAIGMGRAGTWTRWFLPRRLGGPAYAPAGRVVAPGQVSYGRLVAELAGRRR